jgi:hypothetical protein
LLLAVVPRKTRGMWGVNRAAVVLIGVGLASTLVVDSFAAGRGFVDSKGAIHGCVTTKQALLIEKPGHRCPKDSKPLTFAKVGPRGPRGVHGSPGSAAIAPLKWTTFGVASTGCAAGHLCTDPSYTTSGSMLINAATWTLYGGGYAPPAYAKDAEGVVHLRGLLQAAPGSVPASTNDPCGGSDDGDGVEPGLIAKLPAALAPAFAETFPVYGAGGADTDESVRLDVDSSGIVSCIGPDETAGVDYLSLSGIEFSAAS